VNARVRQWAPAVAAFVLWLVTVILAMDSIYALLLLFYLVYGLFGGDPNLIQRFALALVFFLALICLVFVIGTGEYHRAHVGRPESWRLFGLTLAAELAILLLQYFLI
jgi:hypothetical protein